MVPTENHRGDSFAYCIIPHARVLFDINHRQEPTGPFQAGSRKLQLALDSSKRYDLYVDTDSDGNPRNDPAIPGALRQTSLVRYASGASENVVATTWQGLELNPGLRYTMYVTQTAADNKFRDARFGFDFSWQATARSGDTTYTVAVIDYDLNGMPSVGDRWCMVVDDTNASSATRRTGSTPARPIATYTVNSQGVAIDGVEYWLVEIGDDRTVWLTTTRPAGIAEHAAAPASAQQP